MKKAADEGSPGILVWSEFIYLFPKISCSPEQLAQVQLSLKVEYFK